MIGALYIYEEPFFPDGPVDLFGKVACKGKLLAIKPAQHERDEYRRRTDSRLNPKALFSCQANEGRPGIGDSRQPARGNKTPSFYPFEMQEMLGKIGRIFIAGNHRLIPQPIEIEAHKKTPGRFCLLDKESVKRLEKLPHRTCKRVNRPCLVIQTIRNQKKHRRNF